MSNLKNERDALIARHRECQKRKKENKIKEELKRVFEEETKTNSNSNSNSNTF